MEILEYAEAQDLQLNVNEREHPTTPDRRFYASFYGVEKQVGITMLRGIFGYGETRDAAIADYARQISGERMAQRGQGGHRDFMPPELVHNPVVVGGDQRLPKILLTNIDVARQATKDGRIYGAAEAFVFEWPDSVEAPIHGVAPCVLSWNFRAVGNELGEVVGASRHRPNWGGLTGMPGAWVTNEVLANELMELRQPGAPYWWGDNNPLYADSEPWRKAMAVMHAKREHRGYTETMGATLGNFMGIVENWKQHMFDVLKPTPDITLWSPAQGEVLEFCRGYLELKEGEGTGYGKHRPSRVISTTPPPARRFKKRRGITR